MYYHSEIAETVPNNAEHNAAGYKAALKSVVMLKNSGNIIHRAFPGAGKPTVYIPMVYSAATSGRGGGPASARPAFDPEISGKYFNVVTDVLAKKLTGPADDKGNPTVSPKDIICASAAKKVIVALNVSNPMVFTEFESEVDAILVGFGGDRSSWLPDKAFLEIIAGKAEPSGLLPLQMPANMETVEKQFEDVPRDMECHVDSDGNTYNFAFGLNWSGVIKDSRTEKYGVPPVVGRPPE